MNIFVIADLHLSFSAGEEKSMDRFGGPWVDHAQTLRRAWLSVVTEKDLVILPGDLSWALKFQDARTDLDWIAALPGQKLLVRGNHDLWWPSLKKLRTLDPSMHVLQNDAYIGTDFAVVGTRGWLCPEDPDFNEETDRKIYERELLRLQLSLASAAPALEEARRNGRPLRLIAALHYPPSAFPDAKSGFTALLKEAGVSEVVYGHLHGENAFKSGPEGEIDGVRYHLCSLDRLGGRPMLLCSAADAKETCERHIPLV